MGSDGRKMSKTLGNVVTPCTLKNTVQMLCAIICKRDTLCQDASVSETALIRKYIRIWPMI